jgi:hypothetical protein
MPSSRCAGRIECKRILIRSTKKEDVVKRTLFILVPATLLVMSCTRAQETTATTSTTTQSTATTAPPPVSTTTAAAAPPAAPAGGSLASQETNWNGITAEVTEFRRKGNTLTAKVRFINKGSENPEVDVNYSQVYLIDTSGGKKYETLKDEKNTYIAALNTNWQDRWYEHLKPGESKTIWMKFPAPPAEVKAITLQIPKTPPFEDITIQD